MLKCYYCSGKLELKKYLNYFTDFLGRLLIALFWILLIPGISALSGFLSGLVTGGIFGLSWEYGLPMSCFSNLVIFTIVGSILTICIFFHAFSVQILTLRINFFRKLYFNSLIKNNPSAFCCTNCKTECAREFDKKINQWKLNSGEEERKRIRIEREKENAIKKEEERKKRIAEKKRRESQRETDRLKRIEEKKRREKQKENERSRQQNQNQVHSNNQNSDFLYMNQPIQPQPIQPIQEYQKGKHIEDNVPSVPTYEVPTETNPYEIPNNEPYEHEENLCCICLDRKSNVLYLPCKHISQCSTCRRPETCPICRTFIQSAETVFIT